MSREEALRNVGKMVMSKDAGVKMIYCVPVPHGPYRLLQVTKAGLAILEGREDHRVPLSLITLAEGNE